MAWAITTSIVVVFVIFVIFAGMFKEYVSKNELLWPPHISKCPSYWDENNNRECVSTRNINRGLATNGGIVPIYDSTKQNSFQESSHYARQKKVYWDGISN
tara:strand:- start:1007 stop:1309 length:303 start_codon:yes stop_codon:yes gene_type:complete